MFKRILGLFLIWRIALIVVAYFGAGRFPLVSNGGPGAISKIQTFDFFKSWAQWDGGHYVGIAENGYAYIFQHAFFPLYPILIKLIGVLTFGNYFLSAYLISNLAAFGTLYFLYKYTKKKVWIKSFLADHFLSPDLSFLNFLGSRLFRINLSVLCYYLVLLRR